MFCICIYIDTCFHGQEFHFDCLFKNLLSFSNAVNQKSSPWTQNTTILKKFMPVLLDQRVTVNSTTHPPHPRCPQPQQMARHLYHLPYQPHDHRYSDKVVLCSLAKCMCFLALNDYKVSVKLAQMFTKCPAHLGRAGSNTHGKSTFTATVRSLENSYRDTK